ncbi:MAG: hypothetical protein WDZ37_05490 [Solirubrobacterales bacterium]
MPELTEEQIEEATYRGYKRAMEERDEEETFDPRARLRRAYAEKDPEELSRIRKQRRNKGGGDDDADDDEE